MDKFVEAKYKMMERDSKFFTLMSAILFGGLALIFSCTFGAIFIAWVLR